MATSNDTSQIILASIDLGGLDSSRASWRYAAVRDFVHRKRSYELIESIARYFVEEASIANFYIWCGYREAEGTWKVLILFFEPAISEEAVVEARQAILSRFVSRYLRAEVSPEMNQTLPTLAQLPFRTLMTWESPEGWDSMTKLVGFRGQFFLPMNGGVVDVIEYLACLRDTSYGAIGGWILRAIVAVFACFPIPLAELAELTLDEVILKMKQ
ncbi:hypothetical protein BP00DRAFT_451727 [Aspergillus indologenus CBS 114.80]|uniref:Uncharacterized protein n=1 Tax=Aspergillus indologenus CBS 114.80 TaxID=1450541 RepID=A0A2V5HWA0_9EURO|nr:hypothetical protein BP00DRAFT_451727 [Aspergillus indologenus CBS 114.80]